MEYKLQPQGITLLTKILSKISVKVARNLLAKFQWFLSDGYARIVLIGCPMAYSTSIAKFKF